MLPSQQTCNNVRVCDVIFNLKKKKDIVGLCPSFGHRTLETLGISYMSFVMLIQWLLEIFLKMEASCPGNQPYE